MKTTPLTGSNKMNNYVLDFATAFSTKMENLIDEYYKLAKGILSYHDKPLVWENERPQINIEHITYLDNDNVRREIITCEIVEMEYKHLHHNIFVKLHPICGEFEDTEYMLTQTDKYINWGYIIQMVMSYKGATN